MKPVFSLAARLSSALVAACLFASTTRVSAQEFHPNAAMESARNAMLHGNSKLALKLFGQESARGNGYADLAIGEIYFEGVGVPRNYDRASYWFGHAWKRGGQVGLEATEKLAQVAEATGHSAKETRLLLTLGEIGRLFPNLGKGSGGDNGAGRRLFNTWTDHSFDPTWEPGD